MKGFTTAKLSLVQVRRTLNQRENALNYLPARRKDPVHLYRVPRVLWCCLVPDYGLGRTSANPRNCGYTPGVLGFTGAVAIYKATIVTTNLMPGIKPPNGLPSEDGPLP
jgi:hypothetical protein